MSSTGKDEKEVGLIKFLKSQLNIPESRACSLNELLDRKANLDIVRSNHLLGDVHSCNDESMKLQLLKRINEALLNYLNRFSITKASNDLYYLWTLMAILHTYPSYLSGDINVIKILKYLNKTTETDLQRPDYAIYDWIYENEPEFLGEYHLD